MFTHQCISAMCRKFTKAICILFACFSIVQVQSQTCNTAFHIVVLGSSTAYGDGASPGKSWVALFTEYLKNINPDYDVDNIAVPGTTTYAAQADNYIPPQGRPLPLPGHNITTAIQLKADAIIINYPTNDAANNFSLSEQGKNFKRITDKAKKNNIAVWVATPQPRNNFNKKQVASQAKLFNGIQSYYGGYSIDFHTCLASAKDSILFQYDSGDGIHLNDAGHEILFQRVVAENIPDSLCAASKKFQYVKINLQDASHNKQQ